MCDKQFASDLLAKLLIKHDDIKKYVVLLEDGNGKYLQYAFCDGQPENCYDIPAWATELKTGEIYKLSGWVGDHWALCGSQPVNTEKLLDEKYQLSAADIIKLLE